MQSIFNAVNHWPHGMMASGEIQCKLPSIATENCETLVMWVMWVPSLLRFELCGYGGQTNVGTKLARQL